MNLSVIIDRAISLAAILVMLTLRVTQWRWKPSTFEEFSAIHRAICDGAEELWPVQNGGEAPASREQGLSDGRVRARCRSMLKHMMQNTCSILEAAEPWLWDGRGQAELRAHRMARKGTRLLLRLCWARALARFRRDRESLCALTEKMAARYGRLSLEIVELMQGKVSQARRRRSHGRSRRRRVGGRAAL